MSRKRTPAPLFFATRASSLTAPEVFSRSCKLVKASALAPALGGHGERVRTRAELGLALDRAVRRRGKFSLIEVMLPRGTTSSTLARFARGFKAVRERAR